MWLASSQIKYMYIRGRHVIELYLCLHAYYTYMYMLGPADRWNAVPETPYIGQVFLLHPENTAPGIKGYVHPHYGIPGLLP